jgi:hypothetical protein
MVTIVTIKKGFYKGLQTVWVLVKVIIPIYIIVSILSKTPVLGFLANLTKPIMNLVGLPGEAATAIVIGNLLNIYAAIGAMGALNLNTKEITTIALMILISHSLFVETAIIKKTGIKVTSLVLIRIFGSIIAGMALNWGWPE